MIIEQAFLDSLSAEAQASPRLRTVFVLGGAPSDTCQRILNAIEPGTVIDIHRHRTTTETVVCVRGHFREIFYDESGAVAEVIDMVPGGTVLDVPVGQWHSLESLESGTVLMAVKDGPFVPLGPEDVMNISF